MPLSDRPASRGLYNLTAVERGDVAAGNWLLVVSGPASPALVGETGGITPSPDPNANFTY